MPEHSWQSNRVPGLALARGEGDVAIASCAGGHSDLPSALEGGRVAFAAPLESRADLEWLLRGLAIHPAVRHLVVCGEDARACAEALRALWKEGLDEQGRVPGPRGRLAGDLDADSIESLRGRIQLADWRGRPAAELREAVAELPVSRTPGAASQTPGENAAPSADAAVSIPERKVFLSRKTSYPIFSSDVADAWLQLLNLALRVGIDKPDGAGERTAEALNALVTIEAPLLEDGERGRPDEFALHLDFTREDFERRFEPHYRERFVDASGDSLLDRLCEELRSAPESTPATALLAGPGALQRGSRPGLLSADFNVVEGELFATFVLRACDLYDDWPLEATALVRLQREAAERLGLGVGTATFLIHAARLAERDFERAERVLAVSFERPLPLHVDPSGVFLFGNDGGKARAMLLNHDASDIFWEEAFEDPEDLSWYIVDVMPWLLPQHIRYVGQECAALMRAMRERECYLQG